MGNRKRTEYNRDGSRDRVEGAHGLVSRGAQIFREIRFHDRARRPGFPVRRGDTLAERSRRRLDGYLPPLDASDDPDLDVRLPRAERPSRLQRTGTSNGYPDHWP